MAGAHARARAGAVPQATTERVMTPLLQLQAESPPHSTLAELAAEAERFHLSMTRFPEWPPHSTPAEFAELADEAERFHWRLDCPRRNASMTRLLMIYFHRCVTCRSLDSNDRWAADKAGKLAGKLAGRT